MQSRNLVILSDGTGNSAGKITKTNVWRIFQALNLENGNQIAFYDDGVGSGGSSFLRALGGALGFGLARNVRQLYEELCRHYSGEQDRIMLFGFSRGAFTVRALSGLIGHCGIIDRSAGHTVKVWRWSKFKKVSVPVSSDEGLKAAVRMAYRSMRMRNDHAIFSHMFRMVRDTFFLRTPRTEDFRKELSVSPRPRIEFLGVFETVSAYGLPIDEMAIAVHKYFFPLRFPDNILSRKVKHAFQALALDEARQSFHPVLWTERQFTPDGSQGEIDNRPQQVWFPGVHSDVGGGYSNERLSLVPLIWMIEQARQLSNLRVQDVALADLKSRSFSLGEMHDSRQGLGAFYRFKPRILTRLGNENLDGNDRAEVEVDRFKIHESAFRRIAETGADYAPIGIPSDYDVVLTSGKGEGDETYTICSADDAGFETAGQRKQRAEIQESVKDTIFHRQAAQFLMLFLALVLAIVPFLWLPNPSVIHTGWGAAVVRVITWPITFLPIPGGERIGEYWVEHPAWFIALVAVFVMTFLVSGSLKTSMQSKAQKAWPHLSGGKLVAHTPRPQWIDTWRKWSTGFHRNWTKKAFPLISVLLLFGVLPAIVGFRWYIFYPTNFNSICSVEQSSAATKSIVFSTNAKCFDTGIELKEGRQYTIRMTPKAEWVDLSIPASPMGLDWSKMTTSEAIKMRVFSLSRRFWSEAWFAPMGSIGRAREFAFRIEAVKDANNPKTYIYNFQAWRSGTLYLFVNDGLLPGWDFYANNKGDAEIEIIEKGEI